MAPNETTHDGRTDTERFDTEVSGDGLIQGDRLDRQLVALHPSQLDDPIRYSQMDDDLPPTQLVQVTDINTMDDTHSALLYDPDADVFVRATRHDKQVAWSQQELDWKVRDVGGQVRVEEVHSLDRPDNEEDQDPHDYVAEWVEIVIDELRYHDGDLDLSDQVGMDGSALTLSDPDGRKAITSIDLGDR